VSVAVPPTREAGRRTADAPGRTAFVYRPTASPRAAADWTPRQVAMTNLRAVVAWGMAIMFGGSIIAEGLATILHVFV
jgi:hypothetical protein